MTHITNVCPYCSNILKIDRMQCCSCEVVIEADFPVSRLGNLPTEHQRFIEMFILAAGNLKEIAKLTGVSYPTVRSRLNKIIDSVRDEIGKEVSTAGTPLDAVIPIAEEEIMTTTNSLVSQTAGRLIKSI
jgi:hypothetical protein